MRDPRIEVVTCKLVATGLKSAMDRAGLTQEATARRAGVLTSRQLTRIMNLEHCPSLERAAALSTVLRTPIDALFRVKTETRAARQRS